MIHVVQCNYYDIITLNTNNFFFQMTNIKREQNKL